MRDLKSLFDKCTGDEADFINSEWLNPDMVLKRTEPVVPKGKQAEDYLDNLYDKFVSNFGVGALTRNLQNYLIAVLSY